MAAETHSFIDIAALDGVRRHFAAGDAVVVLTTDLGQVIWCNGPGAALLGFSGIEAAIGSQSRLSAIARRQIGALPGYPEIGTDRPLAVRLAAGVSSQAAALRASNLTLPGGDSAIMLVSPATSLASRGEHEVAARAIGGFEEAGSYVALLGPAGQMLAATPGFEKLGLDQHALEPLVKDVAAGSDRLLKRIVRTDGSALPVGFASLTDEPARYLLITVDEGGIEEREPVQGEPPIGVVDDSQLAASAQPAPADERGWAIAAIPAKAPEPRLAGAGAETTSGATVQTPTQAAAQHDSWYFSDRSSPGLPAAEQAAAPATVDRVSTPVRFVWRTDAEGRFSSISPEFAAAVGAEASDIVGESFAEVAKRLGLDPDEEIVGLLARRDTWSGRSVMWPIAGTDLKVPVDLAALPAYGRDRQFEGFRGFGVVRAGEALADPSAIGMALVRSDTVPEQPSEREAPAAEPDIAASEVEEAAPSSKPEAPAPVADPFKGEVPALEIAPRPQRRLSDKVIRLAEHRQPANDKGLTPVERNAFREIGEQLKRASEVAPGTAAEGKEDSKAQAESAQTQAPQNEKPRKDQPVDISGGADEETAPEAAGETSVIPPATAAEGKAPAVEEAKADEASYDEGVLPDNSPAYQDGGAQTQEAGAPRDLPEPTVRADNDEVGRDAGAVAPDAQTTSRSVDQEPPLSGESSRADGDAAGAKAVSKVPGGVEITPQDRVSRSLLDFAATADNENKPAEAVPTDISEAPAAKAPSPGADEAVPTVELHAPPPPLKQSGFLPSAFAERNEKRADTSILAQLPIPVLVHAGDTLHYANDAFFELTGYGSIEEFAEAGGLDALLSGPAADRKDGDNRVMLRTRQGTEFPVSAFLQSVPWLGGKALLLTLTRQPASAPAAAPLAEDQDLRARVAELRTILDTATDGVVLIGNDGNISSISRPAEALFGYDSDQLVGKPFTSLFAIESQRAARDYLSGLSEHGVASVLNDGREVIGREAQGRFIPLFMTIGRLPGDGGYCAVLRDITQWKRAEEDLTQARAQAERTSTQKSDFLARVSHEIRTPLNAIIGFSELMLDEKFGPVANDRYRDYLRDINRSGNHVLDLVNDLLDISKIEAGQQEMDYEAVALNDALSETVAMMQPQANRERVIIRSSFASKLPEVVADLRSVRQIALNVLSNAIRYTQAGGQVIVSTAHEPNGEVVMRVRDTGIGMTQAEIEQALKPFKQVNALKRARGDGTGLGLPLTKAMVEANRAKFAIYSTPGEGTLVEITFPSTRVLAE